MNPNYITHKCPDAWTLEGFSLLADRAPVIGCNIDFIALDRDAIRITIDVPPPEVRTEAQCQEFTRLVGLILTSEGFSLVEERYEQLIIWLERLYAELYPQEFEYPDGWQDSAYENDPHNDDEDHDYDIFVDPDLDDNFLF